MKLTRGDETFLGLVQDCQEKSGSAVPWPSHLLASITSMLLSTLFFSQTNKEVCLGVGRME